MKKLFKKLTGVVAALAIVLSLVGPSVTASAASEQITSYTWEYKTSSGGWSTISDSMKASIGSLYYDADTDELTINTAGTVTIGGAQGYISAIIQTDADGNELTDDLVADGSSATTVELSDVTSPAYVYFEITIVGSGYHPAYYTRITF